jgi:TP901 family phage tail tape measure protein
MYGAIDRGNGIIDKVTVAMRNGTNQLYAYKTGTQQASNSWQKFGDSLKKSAVQLATMYLSFYDVIRYIRQGFTYVKEIDLALTELKKVTSETDEVYKRFLQTASSTSAVIGSTVSDFTDATAAFARLGYSIDESTEMAKTAIVYKNVADGLDTVEESTESIISTMKAYGIEADSTMSIIDKFNAVGNNFAITSAGIGDAMQRSASALYEGGNSIDESIALITAANSVIQNPEQVGTALKTKFCLYVQKCA